MNSESSTLKQQTARGLLWGMLNNGTMQLLNLLFGIVLAWILSRADYGLASELAIFSALAAALQEGGFISALTNRKRLTHAALNAVFWFNILVSAAIYVILWVCAPLIADYYDEPKLLWLSRYAFLGFFIASFSIAPRAKLFKQMQVKTQSIISITALVVSGCVGVAMALCKMAYWSVVTQSMVYVLVVAVLSWKAAHWRPTWRFTMRPVRQMLGFSIKLVITNIFNVINNNIFILVFGKFYTTTDVGTYSQADKWNKMGSGIITGMVQSVAQPMFVQVGNDEERQLRVFRKMLRFTAFIAFPTMFLLALVAPQLIVATVGQKWLPSAELMQLLCIGGAFLPIAALFSNLLISRGCSNIYMWNILAQGMLTLALLICVGQFKWTLDISIGGYVLQLGKMHLMVLCYVGVQMLWFFIWHTFLRREIHLSLLSALLDTMPFALLAALSMVCAALATQSFTNIYVLLLLRVVIAAAVYLSLLLLLRAKIVRECLQYIFRK